MSSIWLITLTTRLWMGLGLSTIVGLLLLVGGLVRVRKALWMSRQERPKRFFTATAWLLTAVLLAYWASTFYQLLFAYHYVEGITTSYCYWKGKKIKFVYQLDNHRYTTCQAHSSIETVTVPGGKYYVRVTRNHPRQGRMDFERPFP